VVASCTTRSTTRGGLDSARRPRSSEPGVADERLVALAGSVEARLLVVAALGEWQQQRWRLGSVAERVVSEGEFIEAGEPIGVIRVDGNRIVVRWTRTPNAQECVMSASTCVNRAATSVVAAGGIYGKTR